MKLKVGGSSQEGNGGRQRNSSRQSKEYHVSSMLPIQVQLQVDNRKSNDDTPTQMQEYLD